MEGDGEMCGCPSLFIEEIVALEGLILSGNTNMDDMAVAEGQYFIAKDNNAGGLPELIDDEMIIGRFRTGERD